MRLTLAVYQRRLGSGLRWTTLGLGPFTRSREGRSLVKVQRGLLEGLRKAIAEADPRELAWIQLPRALRLERLRLELSFRGGGGRRKASGLFPLVLEQRERTRSEVITLAYHPEWQDDWFAVDDQAPLSEQAEAFFGRAWRRLDDETLRELESTRHDMVKAVGFEAQPQSLLARLEKPKEEARGSRMKGGPGVLQRVGVNLTARAVDGVLETGAPRSPYREQLTELLSGERKRSTLIVGPPGVGKRTLLRRWVAELLESDGYAAHHDLDRVHTVFEISGKRLIAGMSHWGDWEERCLKLLAEVRGKRRVLVVEDLASFGRIGRSRESDANLALLFQNPLARGEVTLVGTCTPEQLQRLEEDAPSFAALFARVHVQPTTPDETLRMLLAESRSLEVRSNLAFAPQVFPAVLAQTEALFPESAWPGKAVDLLRKIAASIEDGPELRQVEVEDLTRWLSQKTGLPEALLAPDGELEASKVAQALTSRVMGQPEAIEVAGDLVLRIRAGLTDRRRPFGVYLFTGPTGTGKTELAKALAEYLYGGASRLVRFDMGEYQSPDAAARLCGDALSPEGVLVRAVRAQPFCVVLLDEIEKAHPAALHLLLQVFDEGRLTDAAGETADFTRAVLVMTSNLGARARPAMGLATSPPERTIALEAERAVREFFPPELFNRIDKVVRFAPIGVATAALIVDKELGRLVHRRGLTERGIVVSASESVRNLFAANAFDPNLGARPLKRYLEDHVAGLLADAVLESSPAPMRLFRLFERERKVKLAARPLLTRTPVAESLALEPLMQMPLTALRERLVDTGRMLESLRQGDALRRVASDIGASAEKAGLLSESDRLVALDHFRMGLEGLSGKLELVARAPAELEHERLELEHSGLSERMRSSARAANREEALALMSESFFLQRALTRLGDATQHAVMVEVLALGLGGRGAGSHFVRWLVEAYAKARGGIERFAARSGGGEQVAGGPDALPRLLAAGQPLRHAVLKIAGLCVREFLEPEAGMHVWLPAGRLPELVRVRLLPAPFGSSPEEPLARHDVLRRAFDEALRTGAALPADPEELEPVTRVWKFEPPVRPNAFVSMEVEDWFLGWSERVRARGVGDVLPLLWRLAASRQEAQEAARSA